MDRQEREKRYAEYMKAELIPVTRENYRIILKLFVKRRVLKPSILLMSFVLWVGLFFTFGYLLSKSFILAISISVSLFILFTILMGPAMVYTTYWRAKKKPEEGFRKGDFLSDFDSVKMKRTHFESN